jgi:hypothetical protein
MEAPIGTSNSATRFKDVISRNAPCISKAKRDERMDLLCFLFPETTVTEILGSVHLEHGFIYGGEMQETPYPFLQVRESRCTISILVSRRAGQLGR